MQAPNTLPVDPFLVLWHDLMIILAILSAFGGILVYLIYQLKVSLIKDFKGKHDYINTYEIKWYKVCFYFFGLTAAFLVNLYGEGSLTAVNTTFWVRMFFGFAAGVTIGYVAILILENYWPTQVNHKLRKWRYMPRVNEKTGNRMRLLAEDEEDVHLPEGMQAEEDAFSIDYDVWIDEKTNDIKIEKYPGQLIAQQCRNCNFYTMRVVREEVVVKNEDGSPKELVKHYQCSYCKSVRATQFKVSRKEAKDYLNQKPHFATRVKNIEMIKLEIYTTLDGKLNYEFQSLDQAQKFLNEYGSSDLK
jgi:hypothetical protein